MDQNFFHMQFREVASISLLFAALEKSFPIFLKGDDQTPVGIGGKKSPEEIFQTLMAFSTRFPQTHVDTEAQQSNAF